MNFIPTILRLMGVAIICTAVAACTDHSAARSSDQSAERNVYTADSSNSEAPNGPISLILAESSSFESVTVTVSGQFSGWRGPCTGLPPMSRSDWMIIDETGCLYVHGPVPPGLDPARPSEERIFVTGVVRLKNGRPYIDASAAQKQ